jgi:lysozyme family protein
MFSGAITAKFSICHAVTAAWEGVWSNHPGDKGGKTMYGITEVRFHEWLKSNRFPLRPVRTITRDEALAIFFEGYWKGSPSCENLVPGVDLATYDASVMSGPARGRKWLLASVDPQNRHDRTVKNICAKRLGFVQALSSAKYFGKGWSNRIADVQAKGVAMAIAAADSPSAVAKHVSAEAETKTVAATKQTKGAAASGTTGTTGIVVDQSTQAADWLLTGVGVLLVLGAAFLIWRAFLNHQQAKAYLAVARSAGGLV